jgi:tRNA-splicing ligase RtcB
LNWAQQFVLHNRNEMIDRVLTEGRRAMHGEDSNAPPLELQRINSHHNFTQEEEHFGSRVWVTRRRAEVRLMAGSGYTRLRLFSGILTT